MLGKDLEIIKMHAPGYINHWIYQENDRPIMLVARYELYEKKTYRQFHWKENRWTEGMPQLPYPLFGLNTLQFISPFRGPYICEGEKGTAALHQLGWPAITTVLGASNVTNSDFTPLRHFEQFVILRDNDKAGIEFCKKCAIELRRLCPKVIIYVCNLTPEIPGGDIVDWIQQKPLYGQGWDGIHTLSFEQIEHVSKCLTETILSQLKLIEECPEVGFTPFLCHFEGPPRPFHYPPHPVPLFPVKTLPSDVANFIEIVSKQFSLPCDFAGTIFLTLTGGVIGRSISLEMRKGQAWIEVSNVWAILIGNPSAKKSPVYRRIGKLLSNLEKTAERDHHQAIKEFNERKKIAKSNNEDFDEPLPSMRRYTTDDCTTPKLRELMGSNPRGIILHNDELKGQLEKLEKPGSEGDRSFIMQCWSGQEYYNEDRMTRLGGYRIPLSLTWIGCIPPAALAGYLRQAQSYGSGADGFMQRFQMVTYPDHDMLYEVCNESIPPELQSRIESYFQRIDNEALTNLNRSLHFEDQAQLMFDKWHVSLENDCRSGQHPTYWESHLGKQTKLLASLCIILHRLFEAQTNITCDKVSVETLKAALELQNYFQEHSKRCYESIESVEVTDATRIIELIKKKRLPERFKAQDIYRPGLGGLKDSQRVRNALELLKEFQWIASEKVYGATGSPSEFWLVNLITKDQST